MSHPTETVTDAIHEIHEERILKLEDGITEVRSLASAHAVKLDNFQKQLQDTKMGIESKIDEHFDALKKQMAESHTALTNKVDGLQTTIDGHSKSIVKLENVEDARVKRWSAAKKAAIFVVAGLSGVFVKAMAEWMVAFVR